MKISILLCLICSVHTLLSQELDSLQEVKIKETVYAFFSGMKEQDTIQLSKLLLPDAKLSTHVKSKSGGYRLHRESASNFIKAIAEKPVDQLWDERISNLKLEGNALLATVWMDYQFYLNSTFLHCGENVFQLFYNGEKWLIYGISDTRRKDNCGNE